MAASLSSCFIPLYLPDGYIWFYLKIYNQTFDDTTKFYLEIIIKITIVKCKEIMIDLIHFESLTPSYF